MNNIIHTILPDLGSIPGSERSPGEGKTSVFSPRESHGQRNLVGYSHAVAESDMTEQLTLLEKQMTHFNGSNSRISVQI